MSDLSTAPITLRDANAFVGALHRHHKPDRGCKFTVPMVRFFDERAGRFWKHVSPEPTSGCWLWTSGVDKDGYGRWPKTRMRTGRAHRFIAQIALGRDLGSQIVLHGCDTPACVNPEHLSVGTHADNVADCIRKGRHRGMKEALAALTAKTHCPAGHPYSGANLHIDPRGYRRCRACHREQVAAGKRRRQSAARAA